MQPMSIIAIIVVATVVIYAGLRLLINSQSKMPAGLGVTDGRLAACPDKPNCVSTQGHDKPHTVQPISYDGDTAAAHAEMMRVIQSMPRTTIVADEPHYIHAEFRSFVWRFVDDLEVYFDEDEQLIHMRSAARLGEYDMGANRERVEAIRKQFSLSP